MSAPVSVSRSIAAGETVWGTDFDPVHPLYFRRLQEAALGRVTDIMEQEEGLYESLDPDGDGHTSLEELPLIEEPRIGIEGLWDFTPDVSAFVFRDKTFHVVQFIYRTPEGELMLAPVVAFTYVDDNGQAYLSVQMAPELVEEWLYLDQSPEALRSMLQFCLGLDPDPRLGETYPEAVLNWCIWAREEWISEEREFWFFNMVGGRTLQLLLMNSIINADPKVIQRDPEIPAKLRKAAVKRGRPYPKSKYRIKLTGLRYKSGARKGTGSWHAGDGSGKAWHMVRGHFRLLQAPRYGARRGSKVWVKSHSRGNESVGISTTDYVMPKRSKSDAA